MALCCFAFSAPCLHLRSRRSCSSCFLLATSAAFFSARLLRRAFSSSFLFKYSAICFSSSFSRSFFRFLFSSARRCRSRCVSPRGGAFSPGGPRRSRPRLSSSKDSKPSSTASSSSLSFNSSSKDNSPSTNSSTSRSSGHDTGKHRNSPADTKLTMLIISPLPRVWTESSFRIPSLRVWRLCTRRLVPHLWGTMFGPPTSSRPTGHLSRASDHLGPHRWTRYRLNSTVPYPSTPLLPHPENL
uniref:p30 protein n=1 Tax=Human T-cell leukemia virus type I TaxID=11908 RepID=A0A1Y1CA12_9DELA|nr:p30 protein [Human T-cell leukemia virus type I]BAX77156.1 p30 protein [Human T-cell leukemia virus type I]BAX77372.1 p30 protein [Human T-cell leukemia virus type I]BAX77492.1 p30 protein [Human T-cell leukemia virus type I]